MASSQEGQLSMPPRNVTLIVTTSVAVVLTLIVCIASVLFILRRNYTMSNVPDENSVQAGLHRLHSPDWKITTHVLGSRSSLKKVQLMDASRGWMIAYPDEGYRTNDGGNNWERMNLELPVHSYVTDMFFLNSELGWIAAARTDVVFDSSQKKGYYSDATWLMQTTDGGKSWSEKLSFDEAQITQVCFSNYETGWAIGRKFGNDPAKQQSSLVLHTHDNGQSWIDLSTRLPAQSNGVVGIYAIGLDKASLLTLNGLIYNTGDGGQSWHQVGVFHDRDPQTTIHRAGVTENERTWLLSGTSGLEGMWSMLAVTNDSNSKWDRYKVDGVDLKDAVFFSEDRVLSCGSKFSDGSSKRAVVLFSRDRGKNWLEVYDDQESTSLNSFAVIDAKRVVVVGERGLVLQITLP